MSTNVVVKDIEAAGSEFAKGVKFFTGLETKIKNFIEKVEKIDPTLKAELVAFVTDTENFVAEVAAAAGESGVNFSTDSAAYAAFLKAKDDVVGLAASFKAIEAAL